MSSRRKSGLGKPIKRLVLATQDPGNHFILASCFAHIAGLLSTYYALGEVNNLLINPLGVGFVTLLAGYSASHGPSILDETGKLWAAVWRAVGVSLLLVAIGVLVAIAIQNMEGVSLSTRAFLLAPWWTLYIAVMYYWLGLGNRGKDRSASGAWGIVRHAAVVISGAATLAILVALLTIVTSQGFSIN